MYSGGSRLSLPTMPVSLRERGGRYTAAQAHIPFLAGQHRLSIEQGNRSDVEWARLLSVAAPSMSQTASFVTYGTSFQGFLLYP